MSINSRTNHFILLAGFKATLVVGVTFFSGCSLYKSADRKQFESDSPQITIHSLSKKSCSEISIAANADQARLVTTLNDEFIWEYKINNESMYESTNLKGTYCLYEIQFDR